jgi:hypothetical protein
VLHVRRRLASQRGSAARVLLTMVAPLSGGNNVKGPVLHAIGWDYGTRGTSSQRGTSFEST